MRQVLASSHQDVPGTFEPLDHFDLSVIAWALPTIHLSEGSGKKPLTIQRLSVFGQGYLSINY